MSLFRESGGRRYHLPIGARKSLSGKTRRQIPVGLAFKSSRDDRLDLLLLLPVDPTATVSVGGVVHLATEPDVMPLPSSVYLKEDRARVWNKYA